jgi:hypothetical protein
MHPLGFFLLLAAPFWEELPVRQWSDAQLIQMLSDSPWGVTTTFQNDYPAYLYLATAKPAREAEAEMLRRYTLKNGPLTLPPVSAARQEYEDFLTENQGKVIVIALRNPMLPALSSAEETRHMVDDSILKAGKKKYKMSGHFPPTDYDITLRLVFPKPVEAVKDLNFELYLPGFAGSYRQALFPVKSLVYKGKTEM